MRWTFTLAVAVAAMTFGAMTFGAVAPAAAAPWVPTPNQPWQWVLSHQLTASEATLAVPVFDIDGFDNSAARVAGLHASGKHVICYLSAGTSENFRSDYAKFPASVKGRSNGWSGEKWLDIRRLDVLGPIMKARMQMCKDKGFDAVEPDNVDGYSNSTGFPLTAANQLTYNTWLASTAHALGLSVALKNDGAQAKQLVAAFDFAINEECVRYRECSDLAPFVLAGKAVLHVEYAGTFPAKVCSSPAGFSSMKKRLDVDAWRQSCS